MEVKHQTRCVCLNLSHSPLLASSSPRRSAKPGSPWELGSLWGRFLISHGCCPRRGPSLTATSVGRVWGGGCSGVLGCHPVAPGDFPSCRKSLGISPHPKGAIPRCPVAGAGLLSPLSPGTAPNPEPLSGETEPREELSADGNQRGAARVEDFYTHPSASAAGRGSSLAADIALL